jgi:DNA repair exonuclease SbcCD ATPase subunit
MEAMQDALNGEQRLFMEKLTRDRSEIQRSKDQLLDDQKIALASIYESRSQLAEERAKVEALQKSFQEQKHRDMLQNTTVAIRKFSLKICKLFFSDFSLKIEAETRAQQKYVSEQITRLEKREQELIKREEVLILEKRSLTELKQRLDVDQSTIKTQQEELKQKFLDFEHANELIKKEKERLSQLYLELHTLDGKSTGRLQQLQKSIHNLRQQEEHMNEVNILTKKAPIEILSY